jgi:ATP-dependent helicase/nuclease subunit A
LLDELEGQVIQQEYLAQALAELPERFYHQVPYSLMEAVMQACLVDPASAMQALERDHSQWTNLVEAAVEEAKSRLLRSPIWQSAKQQLADYIGQSGDKLEMVRQDAITAMVRIEAREPIGDHLRTIESLKINVGSKKNWAENGLETVKEAIKPPRPRNQ